MNLEARQALRQDVEEKLREYDKWAKIWSVIHHSTLYGTAAAGGIATFLLKVGYVKSIHYHENLLSALTLIATVLPLIAGAGAFAKKWQINRAARTSLDRLGRDLNNADSNLKELRKRFDEIVVRQSEGITQTTS